MKKIIISLGLILALGIQVSAAELLPAELQKLKDELKDNIATTAFRDCKATLVPLYDLEILEFLKFLEVNFQNKSANSTLVNIAIARFTEFKNGIQENFAKLQPKQTEYADSKTYEQAYNAYFACGKITDSYIKLAKEMMIKHVKTNTSQKRTTMILEKYQGISNRLREMNNSLAQMHGFFLTFKNKLPGFLQKCITK